MRSGQLFTRAAALLPDAVRRRLDGEAALDWAALEHEDTAAALDDAARQPRQLPEPVETLAARLIRDVGIAPADVAAGIERRSAAGAWIARVSLESEGETYLVRHELGGEVHAAVRPEAIAGYATLALELATAAHYAGERWLDAGERHRTNGDAERGELSRCAVGMRAHLRALAEDGADRPSTAARTMRAFERAWNTQNLETRAALAGMRLGGALGARAPRRAPYAPAASYRLHACDLGELRWLRALAERAAARERPRAAAAARSAAADGRPAMLELGSDPATLVPETETAELGRAAARLSGAVRRRLGETGGPGIVRALARLENPRGGAGLREELRQAAPGAPEWLEELAALLLADTGAQTRAGLRTASLRVGRAPEPGRGYRATESGTGAAAALTPLALVEQVRLGLAFAHDATAALTTLQGVGKEGDWTLGEAETGRSDLRADERDTLEAAREIGHALERLGQDFAEAHGERPQSALEQAATAAAALETIGPTLRVAAGWPGGAAAPDPRDPEDVARIVSVAEALHTEIRAVSNRLIAGWIADVHA